MRQFVGPVGRYAAPCVVGAALAFLSACSDQATAPRSSTSALDAARTTVNATPCAAECSLIVDGRPFSAARFQVDSATIPVAVADLTIHGEPGAEITIALNIDPADEAVAAVGHVLVRVGDADARAIPLGALRQSQSVYRFAAQGTVRLRYSLAREMQGVPKKDVRLVQRLTGGATVTQASRPWAGSALATASPLDASTCTVASPDSIVCGIEVQVNPYVQHYYFSDIRGTFSSKAGSGASVTITVTFSRPVQSVTVTIYDPTYSGNQAVAYDGTGVWLGSVSFAYTGIPGHNTPDTKTLNAANTRRVDLVPAPADYVAYDMTFVPQPCAATGDSVLDDANFTAQTDSLLLDARQNINIADRHERAAYVLKDLTTGALSWIQATGLQGYCWGVAVPDAGDIVRGLTVNGQMGPNQILYGVVHSHVFFIGEDTRPCYSNGTAAYDPLGSGGGSGDDWPWVNRSQNAGLRVYSVSPDAIAYLPPGLTSADQQAANPSVYNNAGGCAKP